MPTLTLFVKARHSFQLRLIDQLLQESLKGLRVKAEPCRIVTCNWVQTTISGEDEVIARNYLDHEIGLCLPQELGKASSIKGRITELDKDKTEIHIDIGPFPSETSVVIISLQNLQTQIADGRKIALSKIIDLFGLFENFPLTVKALGVDGKEPAQAILAEEQLAQYRKWIKSLLDRLLVFKVPRQDIERALKRAYSDRDVVSIESLGVFEHAVVCKLGTDAVGLIPKIGKNLQKATFTTFSPEKIFNFLGNEISLLHDN